MSDYSLLEHYAEVGLIDKPTPRLQAAVEKLQDVLEKHEAAPDGMTRCDECGEFIQVGEWPWCPHGIPERAGGAAMIDDQIAGGPRMFENLGHEPVWVESKSQLRDELRARGLRSHVEHRGVPGTDKSPQTQRWV